MLVEPILPQAGSHASQAVESVRAAHSIAWRRTKRSDDGGFFITIAHEVQPPSWAKIHVNFCDVSECAHKGLGGKDFCVV